MWFVLFGGGIIMKITPEVNYNNIRPNGNVLPKTSPNSENLNVKVSQNTISRMQKERAFVDALTIAQSSRDLIQKALNISSQLMGLVSDAMATGRINKDQLSNQMQSINSIIGNYGEIVSAPISNGIEPQVRNEQIRINENFTQLRERANDIQSGRTVTPKDFEPIIINQDWVKSLLSVLERSRNIIMHGGILANQDIERIGINIRDWIRQVG